MKNPNTKIIVAHILAFLVLCCVCSLVNAQNCKTMLSDARDFKSQGDYQRAINMYNELLSKDCPDYINAAQKELTECKNKLYQNKPKPQQTSSGYVSQDIQAENCVSYSYYGSNPEMGFDAAGNCDYPTVSVNCLCDDWYTLENIEWLSVEENQNENSFVVKCSPNQDRVERNGSISIIVNTKDGSKTSEIKVRQGTTNTSSKRASRTNYATEADYAEQPDEDLSITVKVTFEQGKAVPTFENVGKLIVRLEEDKNLSLMIEIPWCSEQKSEIGFNKYPISLIRKRKKSILDYFDKSGIVKERIKWNILDESNTECDCAYIIMRN